MLCYHPVITGQSSHWLDKRLLDKYEATVCLNVVANNVAAQLIYSFPMEKITCAIMFMKILVSLINFHKPDVSMY